MDKQQILMMLALIPGWVAALNMANFTRAWFARKTILTAEAEQFIQIGRAHGFPPDTDPTVMVTFVAKAVVALAASGVLIYLAHMA